MSRRRPKLILCDLGNVLINFDHRIAVRRILPFAKKDFDEIYRIFFDSPLTKDYEEGRVSSRAFYRGLAREIGLSGISYKEFSGIWNEIFFANAGMIEVLEDLKRSYRLHLVSNINELHYRYIEKKFPRHIEIFDQVYLSFTVGERKPAFEIYRRAVEEAGVKYSEALYTDDRLDLIACAKKLGIPSVVFKGVEDFKKQLKKRGVLS